MEFIREHLVPNINRQGEKLVSTARIHSKIDKKQPPATLSFDTLVVNLFPSDYNTSYINTAMITKLNSKKKKSHCYSLSAQDFLKKKYQYTSLINKNNPNKSNNSLRIYIIGHCWIASDYLFDYQNHKIHFNEIADALAHFIVDKNVVVNLIACCAAKGLNKNASDSFAAKLHSALTKKLKKDIPVVARIPVTYVDAKGKYTFKLDRLDQLANLYITNRIAFSSLLYDARMRIHHQPQSKLLFMLNNNHQITVDAYSNQAKKLIFKSLTESNFESNQLEVNANKEIKIPIIQKQLASDLINLIKNNDYYSFKALFEKNSSNQTLLNLSYYLGDAVYQRKFDFVKFLLDKGADPNIVFVQSGHLQYPTSPLNWALKQDDIELARILIKAGASLPSDKKISNIHGVNNKVNALLELIEYVNKLTEAVRKGSSHSFFVSKQQTVMKLEVAEILKEMILNEENPLQLDNNYRKTLRHSKTLSSICACFNIDLKMIKENNHFRVNK